MRGSRIPRRVVDVTGTTSVPLLGPRRSYGGRLYYCALEAICRILCGPVSKVQVVYTADYVFVCVSVCVGVFSRVGASCVGRPTCVCAVWAPLRRVNTYECRQ